MVVDETSRARSPRGKLSTGSSPQGPPRRRLLSVSRIVAAAGRLLITSGVVILLLAAYQLWGTNLQTDRSQSELADQFRERSEPRADAPTTTANSPSTPAGPPATAPPQTAPDIAPPRSGEPIGTLSIPALGLSEFYFVQGVGVPELKRGAGHYPQTPLPGQKGNAAIAGHRTTYGAPLHNVDDLVDGDEIIVTTLQGEFRYRVADISIVKPSDVSVLDDKGDDRLTLTACEPKYGATERIIVAATMVGNPVPKLPGQDKAAAAAAAAGPVETTNAIDEFATEPVLTFPGAFWGLACAALWLLVRLLAWGGRRRGRLWRWIPYLLGTPACLVLLYLFFESFSYEGATRAIGLAS